MIFKGTQLKINFNLQIGHTNEHSLLKPTLAHTYDLSAYKLRYEKNLTQIGIDVFLFIKQG